MIALFFPATPWRDDDPRQEATYYALTWDGWTWRGWGTASATSYVHWSGARAMNQMINGTFWSKWTLTINKVLSWKMYMTERQTFVCNLRLHLKKSVTYDQNNATLFKVVHKSVLHWIFVTLGGSMKASLLDVKILRKSTVN